jgi:hypothetical protein
MRRRTLARRKEPAIVACKKGDARCGSECVWGASGRRWFRRCSRPLRSPARGRGCAIDVRDKNEGKRFGGKEEKKRKRAGKKTQLLFQSGKTKMSHKFPRCPLRRKGTTLHVPQPSEPGVQWELQLVSGVFLITPRNEKVSIKLLASLRNKYFLQLARQECNEAGGCVGDTSAPSLIYAQGERRTRRAQPLETLHDLPRLFAVHAERQRPRARARLRVRTCVCACVRACVRACERRTE